MALPAACRCLYQVALGLIDWLFSNPAMAGRTPAYNRNA
jgi:hypothetical protein